MLTSVNSTWKSAIEMNEYMSVKLCASNIECSSSATLEAVKFSVVDYSSNFQSFKTPCDSTFSQGGTPQITFRCLKKRKKNSSCFNEIALMISIMIVEIFRHSLERIKNFNIWSLIKIICISLKLECKRVEKSQKPRTQIMMGKSSLFGFSTTNDISFLLSCIFNIRCVLRNGKICQNVHCICCYIWANRCGHFHINSSQKYFQPTHRIGVQVWIQVCLFVERYDVYSTFFIPCQMRWSRVFFGSSNDKQDIKDYLIAH